MSRTILETSRCSLVKRRFWDKYFTWSIEHALFTGICFSKHFSNNSNYECFHQSTWSNFRRDFPQLHPAQLRQVLDNYNLGPRVHKRPGDWLPDSEDLEESAEEGKRIAWKDCLVEGREGNFPEGLQLPLKFREHPGKLWQSSSIDVTNWRNSAVSDWKAAVGLVYGNARCHFVCWTRCWSRERNVSCHFKISMNLFIYAW